MNLSSLKAPMGAGKSKKRRGRGIGSGHGKTSCRGHKGQNARSGSGAHIGFEGGQMPLIRRMPKRGFTSKSSLFYQIVNLETLSKFKKDSVVDAKILREKRVIKSVDMPVKILGKGKLSKALIVKANAFSATAKKNIEDVGGRVEIVSSNS